MRGGVGDKRFAPTAPELRKEALRHVEPFKVERARILRALAAKPRQTEHADKRTQAIAHAKETLRMLRTLGAAGEAFGNRLRGGGGAE